MIRRFRCPDTTAVVRLLAAFFLIATGQASDAAPAATVPLRIIATNDFHGNLEPPTGSAGRVLVDGAGVVDAGGAVYLAAHLRQLRSQVQNSVFIGTGGLIGASPLVSALFHDEPTMELLQAASSLAARSLARHEQSTGLFVSGRTLQSQKARSRTPARVFAGSAGALSTDNARRGHRARLAPASRAVARAANRRLDACDSPSLSKERSLPAKPWPGRVRSAYCDGEQRRARGRARSARFVN